MSFRSFGLIRSFLIFMNASFSSINILVIADKMIYGFRFPYVKRASISGVNIPPASFLMEKL